MKRTLFIKHKSNSPYFNLAAEEYFLHQLNNPVVFLYTNTNAVVIGKHQNAFDEYNQAFCKSNGIAAARRLSGGGTVFHGQGNLNFCFIENGKELDKLIDFRKHLAPINAFLHSLGIPSEYSGRNDLLVNGYKVSGNAEHIYSKKKRLIHHGTLLFNADLAALKGAIEPKEGIDFKGHAVQSVRSTVANLIDFAPQGMTYDAFEVQLADFLIDYFDAETYELSLEEVGLIEGLANTKYKTWDWNFGYSPTFEADLQLGGSSTLNVKVKKGHIVEAQLDGKNLTPELRDQPFVSDTLERIGINNPERYF